MTLEERMEMLESELAKLRGKPVVYAASAYSVATQNCKAYFESVKLDWQCYRGQMICEQAARDAFKERHRVEGRPRTSSPSRYIDTEEKASEYFELYKAFLAVYQNYLSGNEEEYEQAG